MLRSLCTRIRPLQVAATSSQCQLLSGNSKGFLPLLNIFTKSWNTWLQPTCSQSIVPTRCSSIDQLHRNGPHKKKVRDTKKHMQGKPQIKGIVLKVVTRKPKKPNSANRRCVRLRLTDGREVTAFVPGEGHNLQEHNVVLVEGGRTQDLIGVKHTVIRGKYDCAHVVKKKR
ncbi:small ribosomal subunit protein uS12m-like [Amphiura filiformis]|uniref:small ribosomal subunit protein uS12m-like n=1 Tax=Amphiura filiformis TaxID=82378 RepID=UPI003B223D1F